MYANTVLAIAVMATAASASLNFRGEHEEHHPEHHSTHHPEHHSEHHSEHHHNGTVVTTTKVVEKFTTFCPEPTTFTVNGKVFEVEKPTTITVEECPCTIVEPCLTCPPTQATNVPVPSSPPKGKEPAPPKGNEPAPPKGSEPAPPTGGEQEQPAPPAGGEGETPGAPEPTVALPPVSGADVKSEFGVFALIGAAVAGMLAL